MIWFRGLVFTLLVPFVVGVYVPAMLARGNRTQRGLWNTGWVFITLGTTAYTLCLLKFLMAGGTPTIFFTRPLRALLGEEPSTLVDDGLYRISRNPMYVGVLLVVLGQAILYASWDIALYALTLSLLFHLVVVFLEEPHLRAERGTSYDEYCRRVPRWLVRWR
jgi:protein-S-isoprenylcysteine O-methyltransferase Ste14